jgi:hypothetical protein
MGRRWKTTTPQCNAASPMMERGVESRSSESETGISLSGRKRIALWRGV